MLAGMGDDHPTISVDSGADGPKGEPGRIGPYRLLEVVGEGGFGVVWLAEQVEPVRRRVALKVIKPGMETAQVVARFEAERQALAVMDHACIAKVFDGGTSPVDSPGHGRPYFVMELVRGLPITRHCEQHELALDERLELMIRVCEAVQHAHQKGVIHRDLKPSNILIEYEDDAATPKVIDFGVAKALHARLTERTLYTEQGQLIGTPEYMSPEQAEMSGQDVDTRSDVYSLGVILYQLLTGELPFDSEMLRSAGFAGVQKILRETNPPRPSTRTSGDTTVRLSSEDAPSGTRRRLDSRELTRRLRGELDWIAMKCLEKDRSRRYESPGALATDLRRYLDNEPVLAGPPSTSYRLRKFASRHKAMFASAAAVLVALVLGLGATSYGFWNASLERERAEEAERMAIGERDAASAARAEAEASAASAEAVTDFFEDMLAGVRPEAQGKDVTVADMLERAASSVGDRFGDRPRIESRIRTTIGQSYVALGRYDEAVAHLERSLELAERELGRENRAVAHTTHELAEAVYRSGDYPRARELEERALGVRERLLGEEHNEVADSHNTLGAICWRTGDYDGAEEHLRKAMDIRRALWGDEHPAVAASWSNLMAINMSLHRYDDAFEAGSKGLEIQTRVFGPDNARTLNTRHGLATVAMARGDFDYAAREFKAVHATREQKLGADHPETLSSMEMLGSAYKELGRYDEAEPLIRNSLETRVSTLGADHPSTLTSRRSLASLLSQMERHDESISLYEESLASLERTLGPTNPSTLNCLRAMADACERAGDHERAYACFTRALDATRSASGPDDPRVGDVLLERGSFLRRADRLDECERDLLVAHEIYESSVGADDARTIDAATELAELYEAKGEPEAAARWRASAVGDSP